MTALATGTEDGRCPFSAPTMELATPWVLGRAEREDRDRPTPCVSSDQLKCLFGSEGFSHLSVDRTRMDRAHPDVARRQVDCCRLGHPLHAYFVVLYAIPPGDPAQESLMFRVWLSFAQEGPDFDISHLFA